MLLTWMFQQDELLKYIVEISVNKMCWKIWNMSEYLSDSKRVFEPKNERIAKVAEDIEMHLVWKTSTHLQSWD